MLALAGCQFLPRPGVQAPRQTDFLQAKVYNRTLWRRGGTIKVIPFSAGEDVVADQELERLSLVIIQQLFADINDSTSAWLVVTAEDPKQENFVLEGRFVRKGFQRRFYRWLWRRDPVLAVDVRLISLEEQQPVIHIWGDIKGTSFEEDHRDLAQRMGARISEYIVGEL